MDSNPNKSNNIFKTKDYYGYVVILKGETFYYKILPEHKEITPDLVRFSVQNPHIIMPDKMDSNRENMYALLKEHPLKNENHMTAIKTNVEQQTYYKEVVTSHLITDLKGEPDLKTIGSSSSDKGSNYLYSGGLIHD